MRVQRTVLIGLASALALTVAADLALAMSNRSAQQTLAERATFIQQSVQLERLNQEIIRALAELAARSQDKDVTALLNTNGVSFNVTPAKAAPAPATAPSKAGK